MTQNSPQQGESVTEQTLLELIKDRTSPEPDGVPNARGNIWTGLKRLQQEASKGNVSCSRDEVRGHVRRLEEQEHIINWHGCLAPADDRHLKAIIENERLCSLPRQILIGKANSLRHSGGRSHA